MRSFNEWSRLSLSFSEKMTLLQNRIYAVSSAYSSLGGSGSAVYAVGCGSTAVASPDVNDLVSEIDELWAEMKSDIKAAKAKKKA
jgi:hypothetical protein